MMTTSTTRCRCGRAGLSPEAWLKEVRDLRKLNERVMVVVHLFSGRRREGDLEAEMRCMAQWDDLEIHFASGHGGAFRVGHRRSEGGSHPAHGGGRGPHRCCVQRSRARWRHYSSGKGPRPVRGRGLHCWGLPCLSPHEQVRVNESDVSTVNFLAIELLWSRSGACMFTQSSTSYLDNRFDERGVAFQASPLQCPTEFF